MENRMGQKSETCQVVAITMEPPEMLCTLEEPDVIHIIQLPRTNEPH